jgi:gliding motility-associated-like protein
MKKIVSIAFSILAFATTLQAQLKVGSEGLFVMDGTTLSIEGLTLVPAADWGMNNVMVSKENNVVIWPKFNSIQRIYRFSRPATFKGEIALNYLNVELNGNFAENLVLAYSAVPSNNYKDYLQVKESVANPAERYVGQLFTDPITFSDLTAVSMESATVTPYKDLVANNMITPNGDGKNDVWIVKNIHLYPNNELKIYDREGRVVYTKIGYDNTWDGLYNGNPLPEDTYYYILTIDSGKAKKTGFVSIVKE